ncbi:hypothetical protein BJ138DRAFT_625908 [Hygrophoropsis aurantiaca]|uniref:Uncharacterized protein n=1 Tax=Hygrophoropsis aurantiaca TaxID=72124 RepID=A0ACB8AJP3_9AGAM|nr:hypothetical protein BJ138DRAFT_625908 [Hygrophoropsis aurantiaca]
MQIFLQSLIMTIVYISLFTSAEYIPTKNSLFWPRRHPSLCPSISLNQTIHEYSSPMHHFEGPASRPVAMVNTTVIENVILNWDALCGALESL